MSGHTGSEGLIASLRQRAQNGREVAFKCDFFALPDSAQKALYGIAAELETAADEIERLESVLAHQRKFRTDLSDV